MPKPALLLYRVGLARVARLQWGPVLGDTKRLRAMSCMDVDDSRRHVLSLSADERSDNSTAPLRRDTSK